jgi:glucokinase
MRHSLWAGVDIGGTKTAVVLSSAPPDLLIRTEFATEPQHGPKQTICKIEAALHEMLLAQGATVDALGAIGISCGGPLDRITGIVQSPPNLPTWIEVPVVDMLSREFGCPVSLENDANAGAVAEHRFGAGKGFHNVVFLTLGTGLGSGIIIDDLLYCGANGMAGEIGHVRLTPNGPVGYNKAGSAEGWASGAGMAQIAQRVLNAAERNGRKKTLLNDLKNQRVTAKDVGLAALAGDAVARSIVRTSGRKLGEALAILVDILNPDCIVIGGMAMRLGELILAPARLSMQKEALKPAAAVCHVVPAQLGEKIGDVAALCVAMDAGSKLGPLQNRGKLKNESL